MVDRDPGLIQGSRLEVVQEVVLVEVVSRSHFCNSDFCCRVGGDSLEHVY